MRRFVLSLILASAAVATTAPAAPAAPVAPAGIMSWLVASPRDAGGVGARDWFFLEGTTMSDGRTSVVAGGGVVGDGVYEVTCNEMIGNDVLATLTPVLPGGTPLFMRATVSRDASLPPELPVMATLVESGFARTPTSEDRCGAAAVPTQTSEGLFVFTGGPPNVAR